MTSLVKLTTSNHGSVGYHWFLKKMKLDTEGDEAKILTQEELSQGQEDHC